MTDPRGSEPALDIERLAAWLDTTDLPGRGAPIETRFLAGGSQNLIFEIRRGDRGGDQGGDGVDLHAALRIPPPTAPASRDDGILREYRIIEALDVAAAQGAEVPHTAAIASCADTSVLGRAFYLMGFVDGWSPMDHTDGWPAPFDIAGEGRRGLAFQLVEGVARMASVDWRACGLGDLGRPDGFHERQVERWSGFLDKVRANGGGRDLPGFEEAAAWLRTHRPADFVPGLMHGDYQFANVMYRHGAPAELAAIVDWEMGTIGDPKLDLAWILQGWPSDRELASGDGPASGSYVDLTAMPTADELLDHFTACSGRQVDDIDYYLVLARWKLAIVLEQGYQRGTSGPDPDPKLEAFGPVVLDLMARAADLAATSDYPGIAP